MLLTITEAKAVATTSAYHYISMPRQVYINLCAIVDHYKTEVSGCGMVERIEHRFKAEDKDEPDVVEIEFKIHEVFLPEKQDNTGSTTEIDDEEIHKLQAELLKQNKNTELLRLHWHSHADMDTFHSGTDEDNYATLSNGDFLVSLVLNKAHKFLGRLDYFKPVRVTLNNIGIHLEMEIKDEPSGYIVENMKQLDKYEAEQEKSKVSVYQYLKTTKVAKSGVATEEDTEFAQAEFNADMLVADSLHIDRADAIIYRNCSQSFCATCKDAEVCMEYLYHIDKMEPMY